MRKLMWMVIVLAITVTTASMFLNGCASGDTALKGVGIPRCMDDYKYVDGDCVLRDPDEPPDLYSNSQAAIDRWNKKEEQRTYLKRGETGTYELVLTNKHQTNPEPVKPKYSPANSKDQIAWRADEIAGAAEAKYTSSPMMVYFYPTSDLYCDICNDFEFRTLQNENVIKLINDKFVAVRMAANEETRKKYLVQGLPMIRFYSSDGKEITHLVGNTNPEKFITYLNSILTSN